MAITLHPPQNPCRFRVTRTWKGREYQYYIPIGKNLEKARKDAERLDESLAQRQRAYLLWRQLEGLHVLHPDGRIIGLWRQQRLREGRKPTDAFKIRLAIDGQGQVFKDFEINTRRSYDAAFLASVDFIADLRNVARDSALYQRMLAAKSLYADAPPHLPPPSSHRESEDELFRLLAEEAARFDRRRNRKVIKG